MTRSTERGTQDVTTNGRGARSREAVLDGAERLIAQHGYTAATVAALVEEAGVPPSSIYHHFGSMQGVVLAALERGVERFFGELRVADERAGSERDRLRPMVDAVATALERNPGFTRSLVVLATQPRGTGGGEMHRIVRRVRALALRRLRREMHVAFGVDPAGAAADRLARFTLAALAGAVIAGGSDRAVAPRDVLEHLPAALVAARGECERALLRRGRRTDRPSALRPGRARRRRSR
jgi:AcrR family transcriptional regulator